MFMLLLRSFWPCLFLAFYEMESNIAPFVENKICHKIEVLKLSEFIKFCRGYEKINGLIRNLLDVILNSFLYFKKKIAIPFRNELFFFVFRNTYIL